MPALLIRYFRGMAAALEQLRIIMKPRRSLFFVLGNSKTVAGESEILIDTVQVVKDMAVAIGFRLHEERAISVTRENLLHAKNAITKNTILWLKS